MTQIRNKSSNPKTAACCSRLGGFLDLEFFKALGDSRRQAILLRLATCGGPQTVTQVAAHLPVDISVVSRHLVQMRRAGVLVAEKDGREVRYSVLFGEVVERLRSLADAIERCCPEGVCPGNSSEGERE